MYSTKPVSFFDLGFRYKLNVIFMPTDFNHEVNKIIILISKAKGNSNIEKVIINCIKELIENGVDDESILHFLKSVSDFINSAIKNKKEVFNLSSYKYAKDFLNTLLEMPYCRHWIKTIKS